MWEKCYREKRCSKVEFRATFLSIFLHYNSNLKLLYLNRFPLLRQCLSVVLQVYKRKESM